jgi:cytochrome c-type biogenesis protein CcmH
MIVGFWIVAALLVAVVLAVLLRPLWRQSDAAADAGEPVRALFRLELAELEAEIAQGRLAAAEAATARAEITRRMLAAAERERRAAAGGGGRDDRIWRLATAVALAGLVPAGALAVYYAVGRPAAIGASAAPAAASAGPPAAALAAAASRLAARVKQAPDDLASWVMLARAQAALGRFAQAADAFRHAVALAPGQPELHAELGEVLVLAAGGTVTPAAAAEFAKAPGDPRSRFYEAEAAAQRGDVAGARKALEALLAEAPPGAPWRKTVAQGIRALSAPPASASAAAAARLAARLERHPEDVAGWLQLARSYRALGRPAAALDALRRANRRIPDNLALLKPYLALLAAALKDGRPDPELIDVARRIHALDADEPQALWYLGLAAALRGERSAAAQYWTRLVAELPAGSKARALVQQKLDSLR